MTIDLLVASFASKHKILRESELQILMEEADPTIVINNHGRFCGKYAVWIGNQYVDGNIKLGDTPELKSALTTYDKNKSHLKPINEVDGLNELIDLVKGLSDDFKPAICMSNGQRRTLARGTSRRPG